MENKINNALEYLGVKKYFTENGLTNFKTIFEGNTTQFLMDFNLNENKKTSNYKEDIKEALKNIVKSMQNLIKDNGSLVSQNKLMESANNFNELYNKIKDEKNVNEEELYLIITTYLFISLFEQVEHFLDIDKFIEDSK